MSIMSWLDDLMHCVVLGKWGSIASCNLVRTVYGCCVGGDLFWNISLLLIREIKTVLHDELFFPHSFEQSTNEDDHSLLSSKYQKMYVKEENHSDGGPTSLPSFVRQSCTPR